MLTLLSPTLLSNKPISETYSEPIRTSKMKLIKKIVNGFKDSAKCINRYSSVRSTRAVDYKVRNWLLANFQWSNMLIA